MEAFLNLPFLFPPAEFQQLQHGTAPQLQHGNAPKLQHGNRTKLAAWNCTKLAAWNCTKIAAWDCTKIAAWDCTKLAAWNCTIPTPCPNFAAWDCTKIAAWDCTISTPWFYITFRQGVTRTHKHILNISHHIWALRPKCSGLVKIKLLVDHSAGSLHRLGKHQSESPSTQRICPTVPT